MSLGVQSFSFGTKRPKLKLWTPKYPIIHGSVLTHSAKFFRGITIKSPDVANNGIFVASMLDLFGMKCATVSQRAEAKDYLLVTMREH